MSGIIIVWILFQVCWNMHCMGKYLKTCLSITSGLDHQPSQSEGGGTGEEPPGQPQPALCQEHHRQLPQKNIGLILTEDSSIMFASGLHVKYIKSVMYVQYISVHVIFTVCVLCDQHHCHF